MVPYNSRAAKKNLRAGIEKMEGKLTVADKVYRSFRAGRPFKKDRLMLPPDALAEVCVMRDKLRAGMQNAGLNPEDSATAIVFWRALNEPPAVRLVRMGKEMDVLDELLSKNEPVKYAAVTLGAIFAMKDHDRGIIRRWAHPFLRSPEAESMLERALDSQEMARAVN
jgi:hypothetical protein